MGLRRDRVLLAGERHEETVDFSEWLLPAAARVLARAACGMGDVDLFGVATGPGSFTGLRVGLTTVKAWAEVYKKPVVGVSRLEAMARRAWNKEGYRAAFYDAHRGEIFGALYFLKGHDWCAVGGEQVMAPGGFLEFVEANCQERHVSWVSLDPELLRSVPGWRSRELRGEDILCPDWALADGVGELAEERAQAGRFTSVLELDANYVRRSDAEIYWKGRTDSAR